VLKRFKAALRRAGVRDVRFHDLRHTFGTRMAAAGVPMRTLQEWMGHRDFATTLVYADYTPSEREAEWVEEAFAAGPVPADAQPSLEGSTTRPTPQNGERVPGSVRLASPAPPPHADLFGRPPQA
jgi:hypothetical protein